MGSQRIAKVHNASSKIFKEYYLPLDYLFSLAGVDAERLAMYKAIMKNSHTVEGYKAEKAKRTEDEWPFQDRKSLMRGYVYANSTERQLGSSFFLDEGLQVVYAGVEARAEIDKESGKDWVRNPTETPYWFRYDNKTYITMYPAFGCVCRFRTSSSLPSRPSCTSCCTRGIISLGGGATSP